MPDFKETEFGTIPFEWKYIKGTEYCTKVTDGTHDSPKQVTHGKFLITSKHIKGRDIDFENAYHISEDDYNKIISRSKVDQWDVIISMIGEYCGFTYIERNPNPNYAVKNVGMFKTGSEHKAKWLHYYLNSRIGKAVLEAQKTGTSQPYITLGSLRNIEILLPNSEDNLIAIAEVLSSLDDKIDLLHRNNKTLEEIAETLFRQWFVEGAKEDWEMGTLGELVLVKRGGSPRPIQDFLSDSGLKWLKISDVTSVPSPYVFNIKEYIKEEGIKKTVLLKKGSLIVSNSATPGIPKILAVDSCIHDGWLYFPESQLSNEFLYLFFLKIKTELVSLGNGSIFTNLKTDIVKTFPILKPDAQTLEKFDDIISPVFKKMYSNTVQLLSLTETRDVLLPKLMSGQVRVKH